MEANFYVFAVAGILAAVLCSVVPTSPIRRAAAEGAARARAATRRPQPRERAGAARGARLTPDGAPDQNYLQRYFALPPGRGPGYMAEVSDFVTIETAANEAVADLIRQRLDERGIRACSSRATPLRLPAPARPTRSLSRATAPTRPGSS